MPRSPDHGLNDSIALRARFGVLRVIEDHQRPPVRLTPDIRVIIADFRVHYAVMITRISLDLPSWMTWRTTAALTLRGQRDLPSNRPPGIPLTRRASLRQTDAPPCAWPAPGAAAARRKLRRIAPGRTALVP